jgi:NAD(P)-dependent dehydrogenase (short-subunit alcohol dehydrogenase family)
MVERGFGRVVNLTSGIMHEPELAPYGASKWAVNKLTNDLASGIEGSGVRINALDPGWLQTDMGGQNAHHPVEAVLPGALDPVLIDDDGPNGRIYAAIDRIWG